MFIFQETDNMQGNPFSLTLKNVKEEQEGWYICIAENEIGYDYKSAYLNVTGNPS